MLRRILRMVDDVEASIEVVDLRTVVPMDTETLVESVRKTGRCVVVHEAPRTNGIGAEVAARLDESAFLHLETPVDRVTGYDVQYPFFAREDAYVPGRDRIREGIERTLAF